MQHLSDDGPARAIVIESVSLSEKGPVRTTNEDSIAVLTPEQHGNPTKGTLLIVADGMSGMEGGERASAIITSELPSLYLSSPNANPVEALVSSVHQVNRIVYEAGRHSSAGGFMGSTVVAAVVLDSHVIVVNVGDSRAYVLQQGRLRQLSVDHTLRRSFFFPLGRQPQRLAHVLVQAIGPHPEINPHVAITEIEDTDILLLCSDGLTSVVPDAEIERIAGMADFENIPLALQDEILRREGEDNYSIIVSRTVPLSDCDVGL